MKKVLKIIVFIFLIVFMTGCKATYNITIEENKIIDNLKVESNFSVNQIKAYTENVIPVNMNENCFLDYDQDSIEDKEKKPNVNYYDVTSNSNMNLNATSTVDIKDYENSRIANSLFNSINVNNYEDIISIYGFNGLSAFSLNPDLESVTVNITVKDIKVITNDADEINNNTYTWYFNRNTNNNKTLYLEMEKKQKNLNESKIDTKGNKYSNYIILFIFTLSIIALIVIKVIDIKNKK